MAAFMAYLIFGFNIVVCKDLTHSTYLSAMGIFLLRSVGAGAIFWILSAFMPKERVSRGDYVKIFFASLLGFFLTQITFLMGIALITPMESSLMSSLVPIYTMLIAAVAVHEPITWKKVAGVGVSFAGIVYLILTGVSGGTGGSLWGLLLMVGNGVFFAMYLGIFRPVIERYSVVTFMKWIFLFSTLMAIPFGAREVAATDFSALPGAWIAELVYLIVMATFVAYFLIPLGQKLIRPTLISMYSYVQPIVAISISICIGYDTLTVAKVAATVMVFLGVYIVSRSPSARSLKKARLNQEQS